MSGTGTLALRRSAFAVALFAALIAAGWAQPGPLTSVRAIADLTNAQANLGIPVEFEATVTYFRSYERTLYVQDGASAIFIQAPTDLLLLPGDRVLIKGKTKEGFRPIVVADTVSVLRHGSLPPPVPAAYDQLIHGDLNARYVVLSAVVRNADSVVSSDVRSTFLQLQTDSGEIDAEVDVDNPQLLDGLLDAQVLVTGAASIRYEGKMQQTRILLHVTSFDSVKVIKRAATNPWTLPITPMDQVLAGYHVSNLSRRIRVRGTVTYYQPGSAAVLQQGSRSLWVMTSSTAPLQIGDFADATGFPDVHDGFLALTDAEIQDHGLQVPIDPVPTTWAQLSSSAFLFDLVSINGEVVAEVRGLEEDEYVLEADGNLFSAVYKHPAASTLDSGSPPTLKHVPTGTKVRVTGICFTNSSNPFETHSPFNILLRSSDDIAVLSPAPWLTVGNLGELVGFLLFVVAGVSIWNWALRRRVQKQTVAISAQGEADAAQERRTAQLEQRRSRILEDINGSEPLGDVVEHITEMVSYSLDGAPCWCDVNDGPRLGHPPTNKEGVRTLSREILSRSGLVLGTLFVGLTKPEGKDNDKDSTEAIVAGVRLATLAIETRKLYSDLVHRSQFDLLTDMYNRFSLDRNLEEQIEKSHRDSSSFGLIYVDLDDFKLVNDLYGHHVGDMYLQEVSLRMKRQLRTGDILGRLGGDEFAAIVSVMRGRTDVEEIAQRLERSFDAPFALEGYVLRGSASVGIAIYPTDGTTSDALFRAADASMYTAKHSRRIHGKVAARREF
ncbi:MAG TPA: GGDEF domain-containing protein [Terracidiphilus sp.]|nr:GGDEF domain-containing protein [Terracidiphilus sp.]